MMSKIRLLGTLVVLFLSANVFGQGKIERYVTATDKLQTNLHFIYEGIYTPVKDITYHEFSADSVTWRKNYVEGDCFIRFANTTTNATNPYTGYSGYHEDWWVFNFCTCNGAIKPGGGIIDTIFIEYHSVDTIYIDTIPPGEPIDIVIPAPDTITGSTTNFQDTARHTHQLYIFLNDNEDVDAYPTNGQVLKWNSTLEQWIAADDLTGGGGTSLIVREEDGTPNVLAVNKISVTNGHLTDNGIGHVSIDLTIDPRQGYNNYWRAGKVRVPSGDNTITFDEPFTDNDYFVVAAYALLDELDTRQNLVYGNQTAGGFDVYDVIDSAYVHYLAIRDIDSLLTSIEDIGHILATPSDPTLGYLSNKVDDTTMVVANNELHVINSPNADSLGHIAASGYVPFDNAASNVNLNDKNLTNVDRILVNTTTDNGIDKLQVNGGGYIVGNLGVGGTASTKLDIFGQTIKIGGNNGNWNSRTDNFLKSAFIVSPHYSTTEEDILSVSNVSSSTLNALRLGGGAGSFNAVNGIEFYTAPNTTTLSGTKRMEITSAGNILVNTSIDSTAYKLQVNGSVKSTSYKANAGANIDEFSTDGTLSGNSDTAVPTEQAIVEYRDNNSAYGEIYNAATVIATPSAGVYHTLRGNTLGNYYNTTLTDSTITVTNAGIYLVNTSYSLTHSAVGTTAHISLFVNDVEDSGIQTETKIGTGGDIVDLSHSGIISLTAGQVLK